MASWQSFQISTYTASVYKPYSFGLTAVPGIFKANATIVCNGPNYWQVRIYFLTPDSPPKENATKMDKKRAYIFAPSEDYPKWVDLLRNETPVSVSLSTNAKHNRIYTGKEPVGEEET